MHQFCGNCLSKLIAGAKSDIINCPYTHFENGENYKCEFKLQDREVAGIRALKMEFQDLSILYSCENMELVSNLKPFVCGICFSRIPEFDGIVLRECLHEFCRDCLIQLIRHADEVNSVNSSFRTKKSGVWQTKKHMKSTTKRIISVNSNYKIEK